MKHINLTSWKGSITDWTKLNYLNGGIADYYADIANIKGNYVRNSKNIITEQKQIDLLAGSEKWINFYLTNLTIGKTYTITNFKESESNEVWQIVNYNYTNFTTSSKTFVATVTGLHIRVGANTLNDNINYESQIMLVEGSTVPIAYEPYGSLVIERNNSKVLISDLTIYTTSYDRFTTSNIADMKSVNDARTLNVSCDGYTTLSNSEAFDSNWDLVIYNSGTPLQVILTNKQYTTVASFLEAEGNKYITYPLATPEIIVVKQVKVSDLTWQTSEFFANTWFTLSLANEATPTPDNDTLGNLYIEGYTNVIRNDIENVDLACSINELATIHIHNTNYSTLDEFLANDSNKTIYYW